MAAPLCARMGDAATMAAVAAVAVPPGGEVWDARAIASLLALPGCFGLLDGDGAMLLARVAADEAEILTLGVRPELRRQGRARRLLAAAEAKAWALGARTLFLEVAVGNSAARALYTASGFTLVGRRRCYYVDGGDALVLAKRITAGAGADA